MFYRKQNYLLILAVVIGIVFSFSLIWKKVDPDNGFTYFMYPWRVFELNDHGEKINLIYFPYTGIGMLGLFNIFLSAYSLLWNYNLPLQRKFCMMLILVDITELIFCILFSEKLSNMWLPYINGQWSVALAFIFFNIVLHLLAFVFIQKDIRLLRSSKRFR